MSDAEDYSRLAFFANAIVSAAIWAPEKISAITDLFLETDENTLPTSPKVDEAAELLGRTMAREVPGSENIYGVLLRCADLLGNLRDKPGRFAEAALRWAIRVHHDALEGNTRHV